MDLDSAVVETPSRRRSQSKVTAKSSGDTAVGRPVTSSANLKCCGAGSVLDSEVAITALMMVE